METRSTLIFSFCIRATGKVKPVLRNLDPNIQGATLILIFFQKIRLFFRVGRFMYRTWNFVSSSNSCTRVHESEKTKSWDILKKRGWHGAKKNFSFVSFFVDPKKLI
jgi:hypothetical protein